MPSGSDTLNGLSPVGSANPRMATESEAPNPPVRPLLEIASELEKLNRKPDKAWLKEAESSVGADTVREAQIQVELRARAKTKFSRASEMLLVREALEQATHESVAKYHASRFPTGAEVWDLTTGIGGDLMALGERGPVVGFELDPQRASYALSNVGLVNPNGQVRLEDGLAALETGNPEYVWADPHRRDGGGRRLVNPEDYQPDPTELSQKLANTYLSGIKLSPMLRDDYLKELAPELEFISYGGECREVIAWCGTDAVPGVRARHLESGETLAQAGRVSQTEEPGAWLYDCDPAAIRAHALANFGMKQLADSLGYLTGNDDITSPWLSKYQVVYNGRGDARTTKEVCRKLGVRVFEIKKRNAEIDSDKLLKEYNKLEGAPVSLVVYAVGRSLKHLLAIRSTSA